MIPLLIKDKEEFLIEKNHINQIFDLAIDLPENMFNSHFKFFKAFEFDLIYYEEFFNNLKTFLNQIGDHGFSFYTILPSAENYFLKNFNKYSTAKIDEKCSYEDYMNFLDTDPGNSPADALLYNGKTIAMYSQNNRWAILGSKDYEIGIAGFTDIQILNRFMNSFCDVIVNDVKSRIDDLDEMLHFKEPTRSFYNKLEYNYKDRL